MQFDLVLNQPDAGSVSIPLTDAAAADAVSGKFIKVVYRGAPLGSGGFFIENISLDEIASGDKSGQWKKLSGRGWLSILEDGIVWPVGSETSRTFTSKTMAEILLTFIAEAKARGCFPSMRTEFSSTLDSNGDLWTDSTTLTFSCGTSLLDIVRQFADLGLEFKIIFDFVLGDYVLYAYGSALGSDKSAEVVMRPGQNCIELGDDEESSSLKNAYLVAHAAGMTSVMDATSIAAYRRREGYFQASNAPTSGSAQVLANVELAANKDPKRSIRLQVNDSAVPPRSGVDYDLGDWVGVDRGNGKVPEKYRIRGMSYQWDESQKYAKITLTLNSIKLEQELRSAIALRKIAGGSLGSSVSSAPPDGQVAVAAHDADNNAHASRALSGDLSGTLGVPVVAKLRGVSIKNPLTVSTRQSLQYNPTTNVLEMADTPAHASTHQSGGADAIKLDDLATPDDNTDLDVSKDRHGLVPKLPDDDTKFLNGKGGFTTPAGGSGGSIAVEEIDGSPAVSACSKIKVPNGSLTNEGSGVVRINPVLKIAMAHQTTAQSIGASFTRLNFDTVDMDEDSAITTGSSWIFKAARDGYYVFKWSVGLQSGAEIFTRINIGGIGKNDEQNPSTSTLNSVKGFWMTKLSANAEVYMEARMASGSTNTVPSWTFFQAICIGS